MTVITFDKEAIRQKYAAERDKRLRPDGHEQYLRLSDEFAEYINDPYTPFIERPPITDHVTFAFIGGGFAGLLTAARLKEAGIHDVRMIDRAGDFGGNWYWNRYPGAMCDTASMVYMPLLEETGHMPTEKYAHAPEILEHCRRIGRHYDLYGKALFHTDVKKLTWDDDKAQWLIETDRGDAFTAQFVGIGIGPLHVAKLPGLEGIKSFKGHSFHTGRWDYKYTGGTPEGAPMEKLSDKRVAIIGTGATAIQVVPEVSRSAKELYVFQRTPSSVDVRDNGPIDPEWFKSIATPGWQERWLENFTSNTDGQVAPTSLDIDDLVQDGWTDLVRRSRAAVAGIPKDELTIERMLEAYEAADFAKMDAIRARAEQTVRDPETAEKLKAWYRQMCKRPCFHDDYLDAFNRPGTHLIDTDGKGVERITERGVVANGQEYEVDLIIYASGFEFNTEFTSRTGFDMIGRSGITLADYWANGMRTLHGVYTHNFPNAFLVQLQQAAFLGANVPHNHQESSKTIAAVVSQAVKTESRAVEVSKEAEDDWIATLTKPPTQPARRPTDCTPGYYNNEGRPPATDRALNGGYPGGPTAFFKLMDEWRKSGNFEGLDFS